MANRTHSVGVAEAKQNLSELLGRVAFGRETVTILRRGKPMAKLVPIDPEAATHLADVQGWLDDDDSFFEDIERIVAARKKRAPRAYRLGKSKDRRDR
jgi:prevent-host-death family protein